MPQQRQTQMASALAVKKRRRTRFIVHATAAEQCNPMKGPEEKFRLSHVSLLHVLAQGEALSFKHNIKTYCPENDGRY